MNPHTTAYHTMPCHAHPSQSVPGAADGSREMRKKRKKKKDNICMCTASPIFTYSHIPDPFITADRMSKEGRRKKGDKSGLVSPVRTKPTQVDPTQPSLMPTCVAPHPLSPCPRFAHGDAMSPVYAVSSQAKLRHNYPNRRYPPRPEDSPTPPPHPPPQPRPQPHSGHGCPTWP